jgi:hypothetical protein
MREEPTEVVRVGLDALRREPALDPEVIEVRIDPAVEVHAPSLNLSCSA